MRDLGLRVAVISFATPARLAAYERELGLPLECYADPDRAAYAAAGFERASVARVWLDPRVWARYGALALRGRRPRAPGGDDDTLQLGGDVLTGDDGRVRWIHRSTGPEDRPSVAEIERAFRAAPR